MLDAKWCMCQIRKGGCIDAPSLKRSTVIRVIAFIDESGDPGTGGKGTRWFFVACAMVSDSENHVISNTVREITDKVAPSSQALHFNKLSHEKTNYASGQLASCEWTGVLVISESTKAPNRLESAELHRFDTMRHAIERCLWRAEEWGEQLTIYIDQGKPRINIERFRHYLSDGYKDPDDQRTNWDLLDVDRVREAEPQEQLGLCVADGLAYTAYKYFVTDKFGGRQMEPFRSFVVRRLWRGEEPDMTDRMRPYLTLFEHGLILLPTSQVWAIRQAFPEMIEWERLLPREL